MPSVGTAYSTSDAYADTGRKLVAAPNVTGAALEKTPGLQVRLTNFESFAKTRSGQSFACDRGDA